MPSPIVTEFNRAVCVSNASNSIEHRDGPFIPPFSTALTNAADALVQDLENVRANIDVRQLVLLCFCEIQVDHRSLFHE